MGHFEPKIIVHPQSSGFTLKVFFKFCTLKKAKRHMKVILMFLSKDFRLKQMGHFWVETGTFS